MFDLLRVAIRNVGRNKRRTIITVITVFIGVLVTTGIRGLLNGLQGEIKGGLTRKMYGELQIHRTGYQDSLESNPYKMLIPYGEDEASKIEGSLGVSASAPRLRIMGLLNHQKTQTTTPVMLMGIDTHRELAVCPRLASSIVAGRLLDSTEERFGPPPAEDVDELGEASGLDGAPAESADLTQATGNHEIMLTPSLMRGMQAEIGDEIVLLISDKENMQQALVTRIVGVVDYGLPTASARMAWVDFQTLQKISDTVGQTSEIAVRIDPDVSLESAKSALAERLSKDQIIETYLELAGLLADAMSIQNIIFTIVLTIVFTIVIAAIVNTSLMTVMERTREIGALMALGYRRRHILLLFLGEFATIGALGATAGIVAAGLVISVLSQIGIPFTLPGQSLATVLYPEVSLPFLALVFVIAVSAALIAGMVPAYRASRMRPVQALSAV